MTKELLFVTAVRCHGALLLVHGASTALAACLMARGSRPNHQQRLFAIAVIVPVGGLITVSMALRSLV